MELTQNQSEHLQDLLQRSKITANEANVLKVRMQRVLLVKGKLPAQPRKALNEAVRNGRLLHFKKDGYKPEAYCHPSFEDMAKSERRSHEISVLKAVSGVLC